MNRSEHSDNEHLDSGKKKGSNVLLIAGLAGGALLLLLCCGGVGIGGFLAFRGVGAGGLGATDIVGRWEVDEISKLILDFRPDGTGTIEVPEVKVRVPIKYKLDGRELTIARAEPPKGLEFGVPDMLNRLERTRVSRTGNELRMEAIAGPAQGLAMVLKKIG